MAMIAGQRAVEDALHSNLHYTLPLQSVVPDGRKASKQPGDNHPIE